MERIHLRTVKSMHSEHTLNFYLFHYFETLAEGFLLCTQSLWHTLELYATWSPFKDWGKKRMHLPYHERQVFCAMYLGNFGETWIQCLQAAHSSSWKHFCFVLLKEVHSTNWVPVQMFLHVPSLHLMGWQVKRIWYRARFYEWLQGGGGRTMLENEQTNKWRWHPLV